MNRLEFEALFRQNYSHLCSYANNFLKDPDTSEEIVQEVMVTVWTRRNTLEVRGSVKAYLFRAVRNSCMNHLKHLKVREQHAADARSGVADLPTDPEQTMIMSELEGKIREAIDKLPLERKKAFCLSRYEGLTYPEIAERLNISVKTVENQVGAALKSLRKELAEYLPWLILFFFNIFRDQ